MKTHIAKCLVPLLLLGAEVHAQKQVTTAVVTGVVRDETGGPIPGATVSATHVSTNTGRSSVE